MSVQTATIWGADDTEGGLNEQEGWETFYNQTLDSLARLENGVDDE